MNGIDLSKDYNRGLVREYIELMSAPQDEDPLSSQYRAVRSGVVWGALKSLHGGEIHIEDLDNAMVQVMAEENARA